MFMLGLISASIFVYGVYILFTDNQQIQLPIDDNYQSDSEQEDSELDLDRSEALDDETTEESSCSESSSSSEMPDLNIWDSYRLEEKYNELENKIPFLDQTEFKDKIRAMIKTILADPEYKSLGYRAYIDEKRSTRPSGHYAVIEDTALNLVEYYEIRKIIDTNLDHKLD